MTAEHPILYTADSVRAYLEDRKTQTRRVIKPQPEIAGDNVITCLHWKDRNCGSIRGNGQDWLKTQCPYGQAGDLLWVRETFVLESDREYGYSPEELSQWAKDRPVKTEDDDYEWGEYHLIPHYRATEPEPHITSDSVEDFDDRTRWSPSIFMPRWASRLTQTITGVRVERLADLTEEDAKAEGVEPDSYQTTHGWKNYVNPGCIATTARTSYESLWNKLNRKRGYGWESNVWVWVISYPKYSEEPTRTGDAKTNST